VELILSALGHHSAHTGVQESGLGVLGILAMNGTLGVLRLLSSVYDITTTRRARQTKTVD